MESRYQRHTLIPNWKQDKLAQAKVIIVGIGAVGNEVLRLLAFAGVQHFIICDPDNVSISNLSRCSLFRNKDVNKSKVVAAKQNLAFFLPLVKIESRPAPFLQAVGLGDIKEADLVISCVDSVEDRIDIAARCNLVETPYIDGGTQPWGGEVRLFFDVQQACYACEQIHQNFQDINHHWSCSIQEPAPSVGASILMTSLVSSFMSTFAVRYLMQLAKESFFIRIDGSTGETQQIFLKRDPDCLLHHPIKSQILKIPISRENTVEQFLAHIKTPNRPILWKEQVLAYQCYSCNSKWSPVEGIDRNMRCQNCGQSFVPIFESDCRLFSGDTILKDLCIPEREILAIKGDRGITYVELE